MCVGSGYTILNRGTIGLYWFYRLRQRGILVIFKMLDNGTLWLRFNGTLLMLKKVVQISKTEILLQNRELNSISFSLVILFYFLLTRGDNNYSVV